MDERFIVKVTPAFYTVNLHDPCIVYLSWIPDRGRLSTPGHMSLIFVWLLPFPCSSRESAVLLNMPATHISICKHGLAHVQALSQNPDGINWTLEKQSCPVRAEWPSQLNKQCHDSVLTQRHVHLLRLFTVQRSVATFSPYLSKHFSAHFEHSLSCQMARAQ